MCASTHIQFFGNACTAVSATAATAAVEALDFQVQPIAVGTVWRTCKRDDQHMRNSTYIRRLR